MKHERLTVKEFQELGYEQLHEELKRMLAQAQRVMLWFNADERVKLLPALLAMKELVAQPGRREPNPDRPNWEEECTLLGITPEVVRQWKVRTAAETDIRYLVGEQRAEPEMPQAKDIQMLRLLQRLAQAVLDGNEVEAEQLAYLAADKYGF